VRNARLWRTLLGVEKTVVEAIDFDDEAGVLVASVRPTGSMRNRCGICRRRCPRYDQGHGRRRWRSLDAGTIQVLVEADAPRVRCRDHGVTVAAVPWARHQAGHTHHFDAQVAWLATQTSKTAITELMRVAWRTVGAIITRVWDDTAATYDPFAGLARIGIDEISYKRGHKYLTIVVDHDSGRLVWAAVGRDKATLGTFFDALGEERCARITHVSADGTPLLWPPAAPPRSGVPTRSMWSNGLPKPSTRSAGPRGTKPAGPPVPRNPNAAAAGPQKTPRPALTALLPPG